MSHARNGRTSALIAALCGLSASLSLATPPSFTITSIAQSGQTVTNPADASTLGQISSISVPRGAVGFLGANVNNSGSWLLHINVPHFSFQPIHEAIFQTQPFGGPYAPWVVQATSGYLTAPTATAAMKTVLGMSTNNAGNTALVIEWWPDDSCTGSGCPTTTAVLFNTTKTVFLEGSVISAAGLAAGTTWDPFDSNTCVRLTSSGRLLLISNVNEGGVHRRAVVSLQLDSLGNITSTTLIAKEGGPVGAGPSTWTTISSGATTASMNAAGAVVFSGTTSGGVEGIYSTAGAGGFIATTGGPTPTPGVNWGSLAGSAVDINGAGLAAFRGYTASGTGIFAESGDAGDVTDAENHTFGNGALNLITGTLSNDQDVDMYRIVVTDPLTFSATTVPNPGAGFAGAAFDTVLTLINEPGNGSRGLTQCDDAAPGVVQSTITGTGGTAAVAGRTYYLAISTPKSTCGGRMQYYATNSFPVRDTWQADPAGLTVSGTTLLWPMASLGTIRTATTAGVVGADLSAASIGSLIASAGGKVYWADRASTSKIRRSNLDGSSVEDLNIDNGFGNIAAYDVTGLAVDPTRGGAVYWARAVEGEINRMDLDGGNPTRIIQDYPPLSVSSPDPTPTGTFAPEALAIDTSAGTSNKIYWYNSFLDKIERCNLDGTGRAAFLVGGNPVGGGVTSIAIDGASGRVYWASSVTGKIQRASTSGSGSVEDVVVSAAPVAIALDATAGTIYWTNTLDRKVRKASLGGVLPAAATDVVSIGANIGERAPNGQGKQASFYSWTRTGPAGSTALPYQIKLTGAAFQYPKTMLVKGSTKVAVVGDAVGGVASSTIGTIGSSGMPIRLTDRGDVLWTGQYLAPSIYINHVFDAFMFNTDLLLASDQVPTLTSGTGPSVVFFDGGARGLDASNDGSYAILPVNMSTAAFVQPDYALLFQFTYPTTTGACCTGTHCTVTTQNGCSGAYQGDSVACGPVGNPTTCCPANFNGTGGLAVQDIFDFLNAWFAAAPAADFNHSGALEVQDIFDFLNAWFAGC